MLQVTAGPSVQKGRALRKIAAIDIGTNSTHLLVASVDPELRTFSIELAEKSTTRLGERDPETGNLSEAAIERGLPGRTARREPTRLECR